MREYTDEKYIKVTETDPDPILKEHMDAELEVINKIKNPSEKTFIDLGAGHGRLTRLLAKLGKKVISIEINPEILPELRKRSSEFTNTEVLVEDITNLSQVFAKGVLHKPVLLLVQNTLGTIEGEWQKVLDEMKKVAKENEGEIILSFFRSESLENWGIPLYSSISWMVGKPDLEKTNFKEGLFVSKTGYTSKWRSKKEIKEIKKFLGGKVAQEVWTEHFSIIHINYLNSNS